MTDKIIGTYFIKRILVVPKSDPNSLGEWFTLPNPIEFPINAQWDDYEKAFKDFIPENSFFVTVSKELE